MLQEILVLQKINGHSYLDGAYSYCLLGSRRNTSVKKKFMAEALPEILDHN